MKKWFYIHVFAVILGGLLGSLTPAAAQAKQPANNTVKGQIPRMPDGKPDFTGVWAGPGFKFTDKSKFPEINIGAGGIARNLPPFVSGGEELFNLKKNGDVRHDDPQLLCLPHGMPRSALASHAQQFVQGRNYLAVLYEEDHIARAIPLDGRPHAKDLDLDPFGVGGTYMGNAVGHWEGDTLVVDTIGLRPWWLDARDHMHTDALHLIERFTMTASGRVTYELTIDDPKIFAKPFTNTWEMRLMPDWQLEEYVCEDNNKDPELLDYLKKK